MYFSRRAWGVEPARVCMCKMVVNKRVTIVDMMFSAPCTRLILYSARYVFIFMRTCILAYKHAHIHTSTHTKIQKTTHTHTYKHTHAHTHIHAHTRARTHTLHLLPGHPASLCVG